MISLFYFFYHLLFINPFLDTVIWFLAVPLIFIMIGIVVVYLFYHYRVFKTKNTDHLIRKKGKEIVLIFFSAGSAWVVSKILKYFIHTLRPFDALADVKPLFIESGYAFPSSHAAVISALAFAVYFKHKRLGWVLFIAALLVGVARVAAGVHFPIDIIGGYIVGFLVAFFAKSL